MAYVNEYVSIASTVDAPTGHSQTTTATNISDADITEDVTLTVARSGIVSTTTVVGFDNVVDDVWNQVYTKIGTDMGIDVPGNSVDYSMVITDISPEGDHGIYLDDATGNFTVTGRLQVKVY